MTPDPEARFRAAIAELGDALVELARQPAPVSAAGPVELIDVAMFARRAGIGRSSAYLAVADGTIRSVKLRGRRLVPASELARLAGEAGPTNMKKTAPAIGSPGAVTANGSRRGRSPR